MRRITKKWISLTLTVSMLIPLLPSKVFAEKETEQVMEEQSLTEIHSAEFPVEAVPEAEATEEEQINEANTDVFSDYLTDFPEALLDENDDTMLFNSDEEIELMSTSGGSGSVTWTLDDNGVLTVSGEGKMSDTSWDKSKITSVIIENGVTSIGYSAFSQCSNLTSVTLPDSLTSIGESAFSNCTGLTEITLSEGLTSIGYSAFFSCSNLTSVTLPDSLTSIGGSVFQKCTGLTSVTLPDSVTSIGYGAFYLCSNLTSVTLPDSLKSIERSAFRYCGLTEITIPASVESMGKEAFSDCKNLSKITVLGEETSFGNNAFANCAVTSAGPIGGGYDYEFSWTNKIPKNAFSGCSKLTNICLPESLTSIEDYTFCECKGLTEITMPDSLTSIGIQAFYHCSKLTSVTLPDSLTSIGISAFSGCTGLTSVTLPDSLTSIGNSAFSGCTGLTSVTLSASLTSIGNNAFSGCSKLTSVTMPDSLTSIGESAFSNCTGLTSVTLSASLTSIGNYAFQQCTGLTSITLPESLTSIGSAVFQKCTGLTSITLPDSLTSIGISAFSGCSKLTSVTMPDSLTSIGNSAFRYCSNLTSIELPESLTSIGIQAFSGCSKLTSVTMPDSLTSIGEGAFSDCTGLTSVTMPESLTSIGSAVFQHCTGLTSITLPDSLTSIGVNAFQGCKGLTEITLPESLTSIGIQAFSGCSKLTSVTLPDSLTSIGNSAFSNCDLTEITIPASVESVGKEAFSDCKNLSKITVLGEETSFGNNAFENCAVTSAGPIGGEYDYEFVWTNKIPDNAFFGCSKLTNICLPEDLTSIGNSAFYLCSNLTSVTLPDSLTSIGDSAFHDCKGLTEITLPDSLTSIGESAFWKCTGLTSVTLPDSVTSIGYGAFYLCSNLTSVTLPDSVTSIGNYAFYYCKSLTEITIPDGVTSIGNDAFEDCSSLTSIEIPGSVTIIGYDAFRRCTGLTSIVIPDTVKRICAGALSWCSNLETAVIGAEMVEDFMFGGCGNLKSVIFTDNVKSFAVNEGKDWEVFAGCGSLKEVVLPTSLTRIGCNIKSNAIYYVVLGSEAHEYVLKNNLNYEDMFMDKRIKLTVNGAEGKIGSDDYTVRWYEKGSDAILATGTVFLGYDPDKEFEYEVIPSNDYIYSYYPSQRQPLIPEQTGEGYFADYTLLPINEVKANGTVTDKKGNPISGAAVELTQNYSAQDTKTVSAVTDENGRYTADLMDVPTTAVCSGDEYYTTTAEVIKSRVNASECRFAPIVLEDMPKNKITLSVNIQEPARAGEKAALTPITNFNDITFDLYNETTQSAVNFRTQYPCVYPEEGEISEGDTVKVKAVNTSGSEVEATAIIGSDISADAALNFVLGGAFCAKVNKSAFALVFDANGGFVKKYSGETEIKSESLPDGKYTVVFIANSGYMPQISTLSKLDEMGVSESEYAKREVNVSRGVMSDLGSISVPDFDVSKLYYTVENETYCMVNKTTASAGEFVSVRIGYEIEEKYTSSGEKIVAELPDGIEPIRGSLSINGVKSDYTITDGGIEIPVNKSSAVIKFYAMADTAGSFDIRAYLNSQINGGLITQPVGSASVNISNVSFTLLPKTGRTNFVVSGKAMEKSAVTVYLDGKAAAETTSNSAGTWSVPCKIENPGTYSKHDVYVVIENQYGIQYQSDVKTLEYEEGYCEIERVTMINTAHAPGTAAVLVENRNVFEFLSADTNKHTYDYWSKYPEFTFVVEITGDAETVQVITKNSYGDYTYIDCEYDEVSGNWIGTHDFTSFSYVPCAVSAVMKQKETKGMYELKGVSGSTEIAGTNNSYNASEEEYSEPDDSMTYSVDSVYPQKGSNGKVTLNIKGELLEPNMSAILTNGSVSYTAEKVYWKNHESVYATFDLTNAPDGKFTLNVTGGNNQASLADCFTVDSSLEKGRLVYSINMDKRVKSGNEYQGSVTAVNTGYTDVYAPVFELNGDNVKFKTSDGGEYSDKFNIFLSNGEGLAGVIANGETAGGNFTYKTDANGDFTVTSYDCSVRNGDMYGALALDTKSDKGEILSANILSMMGNTYREYSESAAKMASAIDAANDIDITLEAIETAYIQQAAGHIGKSAVESATDLTSTDISVSRSFLNTTYNKADTGIFGIGWQSGYETKAEYVNENGAEAIILSLPSGTGVFTKNENGVFQNIISKNATAERAADGAITIHYENGQTMRFDANGYPTKVGDIYGNEISYTYTDGKISKVTNSRGDSVGFEYTGSHVTRVTSGVTGDEAVYTYDGDYLTSVTNKYGTTSYTYDISSIGAKRSTLTSITNPVGIKSTFSYDSAGRVIKITSGDAYINYSYGLNDVTMTDSEGNTTRSVYDIAGNVIYTVAADNTVSYAQYKDFMLTEALSAGLTTKATYEYDENNRPVKITTPDGADTEYGYSKGAISSITAPGGANTAYNRNDRGELTNIVYNDGVDEKYSHNTEGYVETFTQRDGQKVTFNYDSKGNVTKETYSGGQTRSFTYDKYGNVLTVNENGSVTTMTYNDKGDITSVQYPNGKSVSYGYDDAGRRTSFTDNEGNVTSYGYDDRGNLSTVSGSNGILVQYEYNTDGTLKKQTNANGTYTVYSYSGGKLSKIENCSSNNSVISSYEYAYNSEGYISSVTSGKAAENYIYDKIGQLTEVTSSSGVVTKYEYDKAGNRVSVKVGDEVTNYTADNMNRYAKVGDAVRSYDKNGHLISEETADGTASYEWDYLGRMSKMTAADGKVYEYEYDAFGNRSAVTVDGDRTEYLNDPTGYGFAATQYHNGEVTRYILADGIVAQEKNGKDYFYNYNHLGSTTEITDSDGAVVNRYKYSHTGEVTSRYESIANPFTYVGMGGIMEDGNGLWYDRARYVSMDSGSFISPDPAGQYYDLNLYRYANNNSVNYVDLSGEQPLVKAVTIIKNLVKQGAKQSAKQGSKKAVKQAEKNIFESTAKNNVSDYTPDDVLSGKVQKEIDRITKDYNNTKAAMKLNCFTIGTVGSMSGGLSAMAEEQTVTEGCSPEDLIGVGAIIGGIVGASTRSPLGVIAGVIIGSILDSAMQASNDKHGIVDVPLKPVRPKYDPSGYVYAGVTSNVIEGVEAVIYYEGYPLDEFGEPDYDAGLQTLVWAEAADYNEENPQLTDAFGRYGWDTPEGKWRVEYKKDGYETAWSDWMEVPPEYTDVNINLITTEAPKIENINVYTDGIEIRFNQYMDISSVNETAVTVSAGGQTVSGTVKPSNAEYNYEQTAQYASVFEFETAATFSGDVTVNVSGAKNYAGIAMNKDESVTDEALIRPTRIEMETSYNVDNGREHTVRVQILPKEAGAGKKLVVTSYSPSIASVTDTEVTADENGIAEFTVNGLLPGSAAMSVKLEGTDISQEFSVLVKSAESDNTISIAVDGRYNTENTLIVALYRADNILISAKCKKPDGSGKDVFEFENDIEAAYVKIMEWNSLEEMQPEGACETRYLE